MTRLTTKCICSYSYRQGCYLPKEDRTDRYTGTETNPPFMPLPRSDLHMAGQPGGSSLTSGKCRVAGESNLFVRFHGSQSVCRPSVCWHNLPAGQACLIFHRKLLWWQFQFVWLFVNHLKRQAPAKTSWPVNLRPWCLLHPPMYASQGPLCFYCLEMMWFWCILQGTWGRW